MSFELGKNSLKNREGIDDRLLDITDLAIKLTNIDFGIPNTGGLRSVEDQAKLFTSGKSKADGRTNKSYHQTGKAVASFSPTGLRTKMGRLMEIMAGFPTL